MSKKYPVKVEFCGTVLEGIVVDGQSFVAMKPIVEVGTSNCNESKITLFLESNYP
jgi:hypothetical protein